MDAGAARRRRDGLPTPSPWLPGRRGVGRCEAVYPCRPGRRGPGVKSTPVPRGSTSRVFFTRLRLGRGWTRRLDPATMGASDEEPIRQRHAPRPTTKSRSYPAYVSSDPGRAHVRDSRHGASGKSTTCQGWGAVPAPGLASAPRKPAQDIAPKPAAELNHVAAATTGAVERPERGEARLRLAARGARAGLDQGQPHKTPDPLRRVRSAGMGRPGVRP